MKKQHYFLILNILLMAGIIALGTTYIIIGGLEFKGTASGCFFLMGVTNLVYCLINKTDKKFPIFQTIGLFFAMLGDIILNIEFIPGAILFAVAHVFYFIAYCHIVKFAWKDLIAGGCIFVVSLILLLTLPLNFGGILMQIICIFYALIISLMVGKAVTNIIREKSILNIIILIGSVLFYISDFMLVLNVFGGIRIADYFCLGTYYPAQILLAFSLFYNACKNKKID